MIKFLFSKNFFNPQDIIFFLILCSLYTLYFFLIGGAESSNQSIISFTRNDTFVYDEQARLLRDAIYTSNLSLISKYDYIYYLFPNVLLQFLVYLIYPSLWAYLFVNVLLVFIIFKITTSIIFLFISDNKFTYEIACFLFYAFFPSLIFTFIILGKDIFIVLFSLILLRSFVINSKINFYELLFLTIIIFFYINIRPTYLFIILILFTMCSLYFYIKKNQTNNNKIRYFVITILGIFLLIFKFLFLNFPGLSSDFSHFYALAQYQNLEQENILPSKYLPYFLDKVFIYLHDVRDYFNGFQLSIEASTAIISNYDYIYTHEIALIIFLKSLYISIYPFFTNILNSTDLLHYLINVESLILIFFITFLILDNEKIFLKLSILFVISLFISMIVFCYPNLGTVIRYKVLTLPLIIIYGLISLNNILVKFNKVNFFDNLIKNLKIQNILFIFLFLFSILLIVFRDLYLIQNLNFLDQQILIFILSLLTIFINTNNTVIIDSISYKSNLYINIFASFIAFFLLILIQIYIQSGIKLNELLLIYLIILSALINSNILSSIIRKEKRNLFYFLFLCLNSLSLFITLSFKIKILSALYCILIPSLILNIIFFDKKILFQNINFYFKKKVTLYINQILLTLFILAIIYYSYNFNSYSQFNSYMIKLLLSLSLTVVLLIRMVYIISNLNIKIVEIDKILNKYFYLIIPVSILLNIFVIFIISFFKIFSYVDLTHKIEIILLSFLLLSFINNLTFQKLIIFKNFEKSILIINAFMLINLIIFINFLEFKNFTNFYIYILVCLNILPVIISIHYYILYKKYNLLLSQLFILGSFPATSLLFIS